MRILRSPDTNDGASGTSSAGAATVPNTDVKPEGSTSSTAAASSQDGVKSETLNDVVTNALAGSQPAKGDKEGEGSPDGEIQNLNPTKKETETTEGDKEASASPEDTEGQSKDETSKGPVPLERFQEVVKQKNDAQAELERSKPALEAYQGLVGFMQKTGVSSEQLTQALEFMALVNNDPQKALERITPVVEKLRGETGQSLPEDLRKAVDNGDMLEAHAKELATLRAQAKRGTAAAQKSEAQLRAEREQQSLREMQQAAVSWQQTRSQSDPEFKPKAEGEVDGKYELVYAKFHAMISETDPKTGTFRYPIASPADVPKVFDLAYEAVSKSLAKFVPKPPVRKTFRSEESASGKTKTEAKTLQDVVEGVLARAGE